MHTRVVMLTSLLILTTSLVGRNAAAYVDRDVGLGVAAGLSYSPTKLAHGILAQQQAAGQSFAWGFFVDIPLLSTFYIAPAAMLYELDFGNGHVPVTDLDLNFKFIVPISIVRLGAGATFGLTAAEEKYAIHFGGLVYASVNVIANIDVFILGQYKKLVRDNGNIDDLHGYLGGMFHF